MVKKGVGADKTCYKNLSFCSFGLGANAVEVDVKNGKLLRIRPLRYDGAYTKEELKPWSIVKDGKVLTPPLKSMPSAFVLAYQKRAYSKNRIPYPLKRVDWDPEGERNPQNRGLSKFERISWDEATDIVAKELKRQFETYGPGSVLLQQDGHGETKAVHGPHGCDVRLLELMGGFTIQNRNPDSWEGWYWGAKHVWGQDPVGQGEQTNLFYDISHHTKMLLCWGCDPETTPMGWGGQMTSLLSFWFTEIGINTVYICPDLNYGAAVHADKWIPVLPNTDLALQMAIAYVWLSEGLYDKEYIATHTVGYEYFEKVIMGRDDGIIKTPEWAEPICGVPARTIKALARKWYREETTIAHGNGGSFIRSCYSHEPARMEVILLALQGLGKPGRNQFKFIEWGLFGLQTQIPYPRSSCVPTVGEAYQGAFVGPNERIIPKTLIPKGIMAEETFTWYGDTLCSTPVEDQFSQYQFPANEGDPFLHMIWTDTPCWTTCWNGGNEFIKALRSDKLDFVLAQHPWLENDCLFADIILPTNTKFEEEDIGTDMFSGCFNLLMHEEQCIESVGESMSDWEAVCEIAKKVGLFEEYTRGKNVADYIKLGFETSGCPADVSYKEFMEKGYYAAPTADGWEEDLAGFYQFYKDPENYPLNTPSGKLEIYSERLAQYFPDDTERKPYVQYITTGPSHDETKDSKRAEKYPFLIVSNHPRWRVHANMDDIAWLREIETCKVTGPDGYKYEPLWINPIDAEKLGLKSGDVAKIFNERGWVLGGVYVTERIVPGAVYQDHGTRLDPIELGVSDRSGANNLIAPSNITSKNAAGEVTSGYLVGVEKADLQALAKQYPQVFNRPYDAAEGVDIKSWIK